MAVVRERSSVTPRWMKPRWGWMGVAAFTVFLYWPVFGQATVPLIAALAAVWLLWRADRDSGKD